MLGFFIRGLIRKNEVLFYFNKGNEEGQTCLR